LLGNANSMELVTTDVSSIAVNRRGSMISTLSNDVRKFQIYLNVVC